MSFSPILPWVTQEYGECNANDDYNYKEQVYDHPLPYPHANTLVKGTQLKTRHRDFDRRDTQAGSAGGRLAKRESGVLHLRQQPAAYIHTQDVAETTLSIRSKEAACLS